MAKAKRHPFPFIGEGFGTSYKCLEGYVWFVRPPPKRDHRSILALLPEPVRLCARVVGDTLHYGSDDTLEARVKAHYARAYRNRSFDESLAELAELRHDGSDGYIPTRAEWKAFCDDFRACVLRMHARWPIRLVLKPDQGEYGMALGPWHRWSLGQLLPIADLGARQKGKPNDDRSFLAANLIQTVIAEGPPSANDIPTWLRWLDKLAAEGDEYLRDEFVAFIDALIESAPKPSRAELAALLRPTVRKKLSRPTD